MCWIMDSGGLSISPLFFRPTPVQRGPVSDYSTLLLVFDSGLFPISLWILVGGSLKGMRTEVSACLPVGYVGGANENGRCVEAETRPHSAVEVWLVLQQVSKRLTKSSTRVRKKEGK